MSDPPSRLSMLCSDSTSVASAASWSRGTVRHRLPETLSSRLGSPVDERMIAQASWSSLVRSVFLLWPHESYCVGAGAFAHVLRGLLRWREGASERGGEGGRGGQESGMHACSDRPGDLGARAQHTHTATGIIQQGHVLICVPAWRK